MSHSVEKAFNCHEWSYKSTEASNLEEHMLNAHPRPYGSKKLFLLRALAGNLKRHMLTFNGETP